MDSTDWLSSSSFDWLAGALAILLLVGSFLMMFTTIFTSPKHKK